MRRLLLVALLALLCTSCATILSGTTERVTFDSDLKGSAKMIIDGRRYHNVVFPFKVDVKRGFQDTEVSIIAEGYQTQTITIAKTLNPWAILNFADVAGWAIDIATGAVTQPASDYYWIELAPKVSE